MTNDVETLARALQATSHRHPWQECEFKHYFIRQAEALVARGVRVSLSDLDDALCDALMAARDGQYDGMTAEVHLEHLINRLRAEETR